MMESHTTKNNQRNENVIELTSIPLFAYTSLNRCNLPAEILASATFQQHPVALELDCVLELHAEFFHSIKRINCAKERGIHFRQYMSSAFLLDHIEEAGYTTASHNKSRHKIDYLRLLRGWMFNADSIEGAVMKRWVESRFGLLTLNHKELLDDLDSVAYKNYLSDYANGLYNTNALESQLDLLYSYCQYELKRQSPKQAHYQLYRGVNHIANYTKLGKALDNKQILLLNNLSSFSDDPLLSESFGDIILTIAVPTSKILFFPGLLSGVLKGENEFLVIGGVYKAQVHR